MAKKNFSETERMELSKKLDEDLDKFMDALAENRSAKGPKKPFDFDEWCQQIDQHPIFMTDLKANEQGKFSEHVQALQALKYEGDGAETAEELLEKAEQAKSEGNKHFKYEKYRWAIEAYTNGIRVGCTNAKMNSNLYANRAAAQKRLGNLRAALKDCIAARKFNPSHKKAIARAAECLLELGYGQQCIEWIDASLSRLQLSASHLASCAPTTSVTALNAEAISAAAATSKSAPALPAASPDSAAGASTPDSSANSSTKNPSAPLSSPSESPSGEEPLNLRIFEELRARARRMVQKEERDARKRRSADALEFGKIRVLLRVLHQRGIHFKTPPLPPPPKDEDGGAEGMEDLREWHRDLEVVLPQYDAPLTVYYEDTVDQLVWPLLLQYPEAGQTDLVTECLESTPLNDLLADVLNNTPDWDKRNEFRADNVRIFIALEGVFEGEQILEVSLAQCLHHILTSQDVAITGSLPVLQIYTRAHIDKMTEVVDGKRLKFRKVN